MDSLASNDPSYIDTKDKNTSNSVIDTNTENMADHKNINGNRSGLKNRNNSIYIKELVIDKQEYLQVFRMFDKKNTGEININDIYNTIG